MAAHAFGSEVGLARVLYRAEEWRNGLGRSGNAHAGFTTPSEVKKWDRRNEHGSMGCGANTVFVSSEVIVSR